MAGPMRGRATVMIGEVNMRAPQALLNVSAGVTKLNRRAFLMSGVSAISLSVLIAHTGLARTKDGWLLMEGDI